ncbi:probable serine/threonine-protein kinase DDB_G0282963 [Condylostylus longicornis]|uniref:probable serine/threonine-protein kinase DDB_G0282963 n=1 Tax=Condylostylus longicornis TaxID=2530218 RepID=UPI00244E24DC|nr:probable serine/threonine-protein kinase DDB_G0282963 [Condylostylus longicornis]
MDYDRINSMIKMLRIANCNCDCFGLDAIKDALRTNTSPLWEDFVAKASKLHACLRAAIQAIAAYLDAFQKIADAATNSRGASKDIGTALTRVCLRHKAVETRMKTFTTAIMDCLVVPLQEKLEDWKRHVATLDKDHAKEYKRCRTELKKRSSDTLRLQKKARKGQSDTMQSLVDSHMQDVTLRRAELEDVERKSLRSAMVEERRRYCTFVNMLQPVVKEECEVMSELGHLQEAMQSIAIVTKEPDILPQSSEELILESKSSFQFYPESPGGNSGSQGCSNSLGSRKSSVCSISSMNSSGSGSGSPGHHYQRSLSQLVPPTMRLKPGESSDSGFCSSPALTAQASAQTSQSHAVSTWPPHSQDGVQTADRPHTISSAYEKGHQRPALTVYTFQSPETIIESQKSPATIINRPPLPIRCSSLERPLSTTGPRNSNPNLVQRQCPSPLPPHITKELPQHQPTYVNMSELASMAAMKQINQQPQTQQVQQSLEMQKSPPLAPTTGVNNIPGSDQTIQRAKGAQPPPKPVRNINTENSSKSSSLKQPLTIQMQLPSEQSDYKNTTAGTATGVTITATTDSMTTTIASQHSDNSLQPSENSIITDNKITAQLQSQGADNNTHPSINSNLTNSDILPNNISNNSSYNTMTTTTSQINQITQSQQPQQQQLQQQHQQQQSLNNQTNPFACNTDLNDKDHSSIATTSTIIKFSSPSVISTSSNINNTITISNSIPSNSITTPTVNNSNININHDEILKITENNESNGETCSIITSTSTTTTTANNSPSSTCTNNTDIFSNSNINENSVETRVDEKARGSVLEKMSMFEQASKAAAAAAANSMLPLSNTRSTHSTTSSGDSIYSTKDKESFKSSSGNLAISEKDPEDILLKAEAVLDCDVLDQIYEDSIKELNNLIGELDSFQREHEMKEKAAHKQNGFAPLSIIDHSNSTSPFQFQITTVTNTLININGLTGNSSNNITTNHNNHTNNSVVGLNDVKSTNNIIAGNGNGSLETDNGSDKISIGSLNYSTQSTGNVSGSDVKFAYSDSEISRYVSEDANSISGFENPTFAHFNSNCSNNPSIGGNSIAGRDEYDNNSDRLQITDTDSGHHVMIFDQSYPIPPDIEFVSKNSEIVVLRCKETTNDIVVGENIEQPKQRLSSFKSEQFPSNKSSITPNGSITNLCSALESPSLINASPIAATFRKHSKQSLVSTSNVMQQQQQQQQFNQHQTPQKNLSRISTANESSSSALRTQSSSIINSNIKITKEFKASLDERLANKSNLINNNSNIVSSTMSQTKPVISPRPTSLSGCVTRIARRSSINSNKPPPPVRRSSSVTPSHNLSTPSSPCLNQQNLHSTSSVESLPPPPAYLLDRQQQNPSPSTVNVAETVKALAAIRHTPASPSAVRRVTPQVGTIQNNKSISNATSNNAFVSSPVNDVPLGSNSIYNNSSSSIQQQQQQLQQNQYHHHQHHQHHHHIIQPQQYQSSPKIPYSSNSNNTDSNYNNSTFRTNNTNSPGIYAQPKQIAKMSSFRTPPSSASHSTSGSPLTTAKPNPSLIAQLNARLTSSPQSKQSPTHQNESTNYQSSTYDQQQSYSSQHYGGSGPNSPHHQSQQQTNNQYYSQQESLYSRGNERYYSAQQQQPHQLESAASTQNYEGKQNQIYASSSSHYEQYTQFSSTTTSSISTSKNHESLLHSSSSLSSSTKQIQLNQTKNPSNHHNQHHHSHYQQNSTSSNHHHNNQQSQQQQQSHQVQNSHYQKSSQIKSPSASQMPPIPAQRTSSIKHQHHHHHQHLHQQPQQQQHHTQSSSNVQPTQGQQYTQYQQQQHHYQQQQQQQNNHYQQQPTQQQYHHASGGSGSGQNPTQNNRQIQQKIFVSTNPFITTTAINYSSSSVSSASSHYGNHSQGQYTANPNYSSCNESNVTKTGSIRGKSKAEFLENLNAKLAKQGLSGRALSVRNLINSKALPDPRICHESLMDQIKRGATLKRNQKVNDRSAPKIH